MKIVVLSLLYVASSFALTAQKIIEKNIVYDNQYIEVDVPFASHIDIKTWDEPRVYLKADIFIFQPEYLDLYKLKVSEGKSNITIASETNAVFKAFKDYWKKNRRDKKQYYYAKDTYDFKYTVYIPKNAQFKLKSINGDMNSEIIEGNFTADLINGDIEIKKYSGDLDLTTVNGEIDLNVANTRLVAETVNGEIYADKNLKLIAHDRHVGSKVESEASNAANRLRLNTVNGNMYLRM